MSFEGNCSNACGINKCTNCVRAKKNYKSTTHKTINLEINNIIQDQMVRISEAMVRIIKITSITNVVIIRLIDFDRMEGGVFIIEKNT
jgi:hypothetical protein